MLTFKVPMNGRYKIGIVPQNTNCRLFNSQLEGHLKIVTATDIKPLSIL